MDRTARVALGVSGATMLAFALAVALYGSHSFTASHWAASWPYFLWTVLDVAAVVVDRPLTRAISIAMVASQGGTALLNLSDGALLLGGSRINGAVGFTITAVAAVIGVASALPRWTIAPLRWAQALVLVQAGIVGFFAYVTLLTLGHPDNTNPLASAGIPVILGIPIVWATVVLYRSSAARLVITVVSTLSILACLLFTWYLEALISAIVLGLIWIPSASRALYSSSGHWVDAYGPPPPAVDP